MELRLPIELYWTVLVVLHYCLTPIEAFFTPQGPCSEGVKGVFIAMNNYTETDSHLYYYDCETGSVTQNLLQGVDVKGK